MCIVLVTYMTPKLTFFITSTSLNGTEIDELRARGTQWRE